VKTNRSAPILLVVFGMLIGLIAVSSLGALHRVRESYRAVSGLNDRYRRTDRALNAIASGIYMVGLVTRDYLLDPSNANAVDYRSQLISERADMEQEFRDLRSDIRDQDKPQLERLRIEVEGYWDALGPLFEWTPEEKSAHSRAFLRREVLPRRRSALRITSEVSKLTEANLEQQRREVNRDQDSMAGFIARMMAITVLLGLGIAAVTVLRMTKLEKHSEEQRLRTEEAEKELRRLSRQLVQAQEEERKSISRELHDEVGQMLTALRMELRSLQDLRTAPEAQFNDHIDSAKRLGEQSLRASRYGHGAAAVHARRSRPGLRAAMAGAPVRPADGHSGQRADRRDPGLAAGGASHLHLSNRSGGTHELRAACKGQAHRHPDCRKAGGNYGFDQRRRRRIRHLEGAGPRSGPARNAGARDGARRRLEHLVAYPRGNGSFGRTPACDGGRLA
jgi:signal transduction histidine kinase